MNIFLLISAIVLLVGYILYLTRRKDFVLLKSPPITQKLPRSKYEQSLKEYNKLKSQPTPRLRREQMERTSELFYLDQKLKQIQRETEEEQHNYYLATKERDIAWQDYHDFFQQMSFFEKIFSPSKITELNTLRKLYQDSVKKVNLELSKFSARNRIKHYENRSINERFEEIEQKSKQYQYDNPITGESTPIQSDLSMEDVPDEIIDLNEADKSEIDFKPTIKAPSQPQTVENMTHEVSTRKNHFGQADFNDRYPDFNGATFIDETLSIEEQNFTVVRDANFDNSFLVSVHFLGRHQYQNCSFKNTDFSYSQWNPLESPHRILNCYFEGSKFNNAQLQFMAFYNCQFIQTDFQGAIFNMVKFVNCIFNECKIEGIDFSKTVMSSEMLEQIDFSHCLHPPKNSFQTNENPTQDESEDDFSEP